MDKHSVLCKGSPVYLDNSDDVACPDHFRIKFNASLVGCQGNRGLQNTVCSVEFGFDVMDTGRTCHASHLVTQGVQMSNRSTYSTWLEIPHKPYETRIVRIIILLNILLDITNPDYWLKYSSGETLFSLVPTLVPTDHTIYYFQTDAVFILESNLNLGSKVSTIWTLYSWPFRRTL